MKDKDPDENGADITDTPQDILWVGGQTASAGSMLCEVEHELRV